MVCCCSWYMVVAAATVAYWLVQRYLRAHNAARYWIWDDGGDGEAVPRVRIDTSPAALNFPKGFLWGVASAAHQVEGNSTNNQWSEWEQQTTGAPHNKPRTKHRAGAACDHWNRVAEDTKLITDLGMNSSRFSVEWSKVEPQQGVWSEEALAHYDAELDALVGAGLTPMITLHHFTHPIWWHKLGAFEVEDNLKHFVAFAERVFERYADRCTLWCTINEPEVLVTGGYFSGQFPPGIRDDARKAGQVLRNVLEAHVRVYTALKAHPTLGGARVSIGIVKDIFQFDPRNPLNPIDCFIARTNDALFNECIFEFFRSGKFVFSAPGVSVTHHNPKAAASNDFIGLNYYSHYLVSAQLNLKQPFKLTHNTRDVMTDMSYPIYAEGLYRAIARCATLKVPIYITENGLADATDDRRALFIRRYTYAVSRAIADGYDVRGYFWWSLMDNFEWAEGYTMRFGLYECDFNLSDTAVAPKLPHRLRDGSKALVAVVDAHNRKHGLASASAAASVSADTKRNK